MSHPEPIRRDRPTVVAVRAPSSAEKLFDLDFEKNAYSHEELLLERLTQKRLYYD